MKQASSPQVSHFEELRAELRVKYRVFLEASRTGGAIGVDPGTGELNGEGKYRFAGYTTIGTAYTPDSGILFVSLDIGKDLCPQPPEDLIWSQGSEWPTNLHHKGMRLQAAKLLSGTAYRSYLDRVTIRGLAANEIWRHWRGSEAPAADPLDYAAVTNFYKFVTIGRGCKRKERSGAKDRHHRVGGRHGPPEKRLLLGQIEVLRPAHIVFHNRRLPGYFRWPEDIRKEFLALIDVRREEGSPLTIWRSHHPAWRRWGTAGRLIDGTEPWRAEELRMGYETIRE
ncbi:MAG: hypothetical protein OXH05_01980 [Acidobacteria bacterium]|nr:hypothetical protein [Acidobacteriota bacterium]